MSHKEYQPFEDKKISKKSKKNVEIFWDYFTGGKGGEYDTYKNPTLYDERQLSRYYRRDNLARGVVDVLEEKEFVGESTRALDIGAGTGILSLELARRGCGLVTSLDLFSDPLIKLQEKAESEDLGDSIFTVKADMNKQFPFKENTFDLVVSLRATRYVANFEDWLNQIKTVLRPQGNFLLPAFGIDAIPWRRHSTQGIRQVTSYKNLKKIIEDSGFLVDSYEHEVDHSKVGRDVPFYYSPKYILAKNIK